MRDAAGELPLEPDEDDLPAELRERPGPFRIAAVDPETGERYEEPITRDQLASAFAAARRIREDEDAG